MGCSSSKEKHTDRRGLLAADDDDFPNPRQRMDTKGINAKAAAKESSKKRSSSSTKTNSKSSKPNSSSNSSSKHSNTAKAEAPKEIRPEQQQQQQQQTAPAPQKEKQAQPANHAAQQQALPPVAAKPQTKNQPYNRAKDRVDAIECTKSIETRDIKFRYAYLSQRGFYPDDPFKANQDAYKVQERVLFHARDSAKKPNEASKYQHANQRKDAFFGVFDGHGKDGDGCALYARDHIVEQHIVAFG